MTYDLYSIRDALDREVATAADLEGAALGYRTMIAEGATALTVWRDGEYVTVQVHDVAARQIEAEREVA